MEKPASHNQLIRQHSDLFEELSELVHGWELDFCQLGRADAPFYLQQVEGPSILISRAFFASSFYQVGSAPPGYRTISMLVPRAGNTSWRWCGESVAPGSLLVMPVGGEFESISAPNFESIHLAIPIPLLEQIAETQFNLPLQSLMPDTRCFCRQGGEPLQSLRSLLKRLTRGPEQVCSPGALWLTPRLEREMAFLVLACLAGGGAELPRGPRSGRMKCLARAIEILNEADSSFMEVGELVSVVDVSRRTLENAFSDGLGVGPAAFLKSRRLHRLNRALLAADPSLESVATVAKAHGFQHLGQLATDYRSLFGELPSATLKRVSGRRAI